MSIYWLTFGQRYRREPHPQLGNSPGLPEGWVTVEADSPDHARRIVTDALGLNWSSIYPAGIINTRYYPSGDLGTLEELLNHHTLEEA